MGNLGNLQPIVKTNEFISNIDVFDLNSRNRMIRNLELWTTSINLDTMQITLTETL